MKTLYLHIGHYKTGTSALQDYLSKNAKTLRKHGFLYPASSRPKKGKTNHGHLSLSLAQDYGFNPPSWYDDDISADQAYETLRQEIDAAPEDNIIISSEEFVQLALRTKPKAAIQDLKARLEGYNVKVVFYVREPLSLLKSWYNQVNKGRMGTRNFPTFFMGLKPQFLGQEAIWRYFSDVFGPENMLVLTYKSVGRDHICEFLNAVGCDHVPDEEIGLVNTSQPTPTLDVQRLSKDRRHSYDEATITNITNVTPFVSRANRVTKAYNKVAAHADVPAPSRLTPVSVIEYYSELVRGLGSEMELNHKEGARMRNLALQAEGTDVALAAALMDVARTIRPNGKMIERRLAGYQKVLEAEVETDKQSVG